MPSVKQEESGRKTEVILRRNTESCLTFQTKENPEGSDNMPQINSQDPGIEESCLPHPTLGPRFWVEWEDSKIPEQSWLVCVRKDNLKDDGDSEHTWQR